MGLDGKIVVFPPSFIVLLAGKQDITS